MVDCGHLEVGVLAETVEELAERVGGLRRIGCDGGGRRSVTLAEGVGERVHRGVQPIRRGVAAAGNRKDERGAQREQLAAQAHHARAGRISRGSANTSVSFAVVTGCTMS